MSRGHLERIDVAEVRGVVREAVNVLVRDHEGEGGEGEWGEC